MKISSKRKNIPSAKESFTNTGSVFRKLLLVISFLEGGSVMVCELLGAKLTAPYFGASLYVWASVLSVTLGGLAVGYFLGGSFSKKYNNRKLLFFILLVAGVLLFGMPTIAKFSLQFTLDLGVQWGSLLALTLFLFPPLIFFGMTSPVIVNLITETADSSGKNAGLIYSISTLGGILLTLLCGFYVLPHFGIVKPAMFFGGLMLSISLLYFIFNKKLTPLLALVAVFILFPKKENRQSGRYKIIYESEGILGQIKVIDHLYFSNAKGWKQARSIFVNNIAQTIMDIENPAYSLWDYAYYVSYAASVFPPKSKVLLLGLGGGTLCKQFRRQGFEVEAVELDERIKEVALQYFDVDASVKITIDDARHFLRTAKKKYDLIVFDVFHAEIPPAYLVTVESLNELRKNLNPGGMVLVNYYGFHSGPLGEGAAWLYNTFLKAGFKTHVLISNRQSEMMSNLLFLGSDAEIDFSKTHYTEPAMPEIKNLEDCFLNISLLNVEKAGVFTDDVPVMEHLSAEPSLAWRNAYNELFTKNFFLEGIGIY